MAKHRRGNNEGSIIKRKDGRWMAAATVGYDPATGKPKRKFFYGKKREDVKVKLDEALGLVKNGIYTEPTKQTVGEWLTTWLEQYMKPSLRPTTYESYKMQIEKHLAPALEYIRLRGLQTAHLQKLYNEKLYGGRADKKKGGLSPRSVRYMHTIIHAALEQARKEGKITINPAGAVVLPRLEKKEMKTLPAEKIGAFLAAARETRHFAAYLLELATGLRRGELLGLRWQDMDLEQGTLRVTQGLVRTKEGLVFQEPKTPLSRRTIGIPAGIIKELRAHKSKQNERKLKIGNYHEKENPDGYHDKGLAFCSEEGKPLDTRAFTKNFKSTLAKAGLPDMRFHDLRHTVATLAKEEGVSDRTIQEMLGHHSAAFTMSVYSHVTPKMKKEATDKIGSLLASHLKE